MLKSKLNLVNINSSQRTLREHIQKNIDRFNDQIKTLSQKIISLQNGYVSAFPVPANVPPHDDVYQLNVVPEPPV